MKTKIRTAWDWTASWFGPVRWYWSLTAFVVGGAIGILLAATTAK